MFDYDPSDEVLPADIAATLDKLQAQAEAAAYARKAEAEEAERAELQKFMQSCAPALERIPDQFKPFLHYVKTTDHLHRPLLTMRMEIPGCWPFNFWMTGQRNFGWKGLDHQGHDYYGANGVEFATIEEMALRARNVWVGIEESKRMFRENSLRAQEAAARRAPAEADPAPAPAADWQVQITDGLRENPGDPVWLSLRATLSIVQRLESIESALIVSRD